MLKSKKRTNKSKGRPCKYGIFYRSTGGKVVQKTFDSYEKARQHARKLARKDIGYEPNFLDRWRTPYLSDFDLTIRKTDRDRIVPHG